MKKYLLLFGIVALAGWSPAHAATLTADLNIDHCTGTCGGTDYGDVTVTDVTGGVTFTVQLQNGAKFQEAGNGLNLFNFGFTQDVAAGDVTNITLTGANGLAFVAPASNQDGFGDFKYAIESDHPPNQSAANALLTFDVTGVTVADLIVSVNGNPNVLFAADIFGVNGLTGLVGSTVTNDCQTCENNATPIPGAVWLFAGGLGVLGMVTGRRRKQKSAWETTQNEIVA